MQKIEHKIDLNLSQPNNFEYIHAMQGDYDSDIVTATLYDKNTLYTIDVDKIVLQGTTESNSLIVYDKVIINDDKHSVTFPLTKEMLSEYGDISFILSLVDTNNKQKKSTFPFIIKNTKDTTSSISVSVLQAITDYVKRAEDAANKAEQNSNTSLENKNLAEKAANTAIQKANEALTSANKAKSSETNSENSEINASTSASSAKSSANTATSQANSASISATNSANSAKLSQSWAIGDTKSRDNEDTNNSKYYSVKSSNYANNAKASETASKTSEINTSKSETNAKSSADSASLSATNASTSETNAQSSATASSKSAQASATSEANAKQFATNAKASETSASKYASNASISATTASEKADVATAKATESANSATDSLTYANQSKDYRDQCKSIAQGLEGALLPKGTIAFAEIPTKNIKTGDMYNISDDFTSDDRFKDGSGKSYTAGTNIYYTSDGLWDVLIGDLEKYAFKTDLEDHIGNKSNPHGVTKSQIGLGNVPNVSTNDQTITYTDPSTLSTLSSGEKISVAFGKIKKAISDLISHIADTTKHITSSERTLWNTVSNKIDKVDGKGLSTNDFTTAEKNKLNGIESGANKTTVDGSLSSTSTNPVQNKVVNSALNGKANSSHTHDDRYYTENEMNTKLSEKVDLSADGVSNAINKLSTGTSTPIDTDYYVSQYAGGGTTTTSYHRRPVSALWNYIKEKADKVYSALGHKHTKSEITDFPSSMPASDVYNWAKASNKPSYTASEVGALPINTSGGITSCGGSGKYSYFKIATIKITTNYVNRPIVFELSGRGKGLSQLTVMFGSVDNVDPTLSFFKTNQENAFWIKKTATSTWEVYGQYNELWGSYCLHRVTGTGADIGVTVNMSNIDALPNGCTQASYGGNANYASNAGNSTTVNGHTVNSDVPSGAKFTDTNTWRPQPDWNATSGDAMIKNKPSLGNASSKTIRTLSTTSASGWKDLSTDQRYVPDMAFMAYWNGAYSGSSSNLAYCNKGAFGTAATKNTGDFATANHSHSNYLTGITKSMVTTALGYTPPTSDTNTWRPVINNLVTTEAGYALDAMQGKALNDKISVINDSLTQFTFVNIVAGMQNYTAFYNSVTKMMYVCFTVNLGKVSTSSSIAVLNDHAHTPDGNAYTFPLSAWDATTGNQVLSYGYISGKDIKIYAPVCNNFMAYGMLFYHCK